MDELRVIYELILAIWHLFKKYGVKRLDDDKWDSLLVDCDALRRKALEQGQEYYELFYDLYVALRNYYQRKEKQ